MPVRAILAWRLFNCSLEICSEVPYDCLTEAPDLRGRAQMYPCHAARRTAVVALVGEADIIRWC